MRMWGGRFATGTDPLAADFTRSIEVDRALAADDLRGSIAHVHGLARAGLVTAVEEAEPGGGLGGLTAGGGGGGGGGERCPTTPPGAARATTRSRSTCGSGCGGRSAGSMPRSWSWSAPWWAGAGGAARRGGRAWRP